MATGTTSNPSHLIWFFNPGTTSTNSTTYKIPFNQGVLKAWGTWNGATVTLWGATPGSATFIQLSDPFLNPISLTSNSQLTLENIVWNDEIYATISNAGASTSLYVTLQRL